MTKEDKLLIDKVVDKYQTALRDQYMTHTGFLDLNQQSLVADYGQKHPLKGIFHGGYAMAERRFIYFLPDYMDALPYEDPMYPCELIHLRFQGGKENQFARKSLTHRDYLGALMNLGIDRSLTGDILTTDTGAYVFVMKHMVSFIKDNLYQVGRQQIEVIEHQSPDLLAIQSNYQEITGTVASLRVDNIIKLVFNLSRNQSSDLISAKKVYINHRLAEKMTYKVKEGDVITVRGLGKCCFVQENNKTKKDRLHITCRVYK